MSEHAKPTIEVSNLGPISSAKIVLERHGITVVTADNGSGKSILIDAVKAAQRGNGSVPLRDQTKRGSVDAFGAHITIGQTVRHTGECEVQHIEGKFDISSLIKPPFKGEKEKNAYGIKALLALTGLKADPEMFRAHPGLFDFDYIVEVDSLKTDDPIEMARRIKKNYDDAAKKLNADAEREEGHAAGLAAHEGVDLNGEADKEKLQAAYNAARDEVVRLETQEQTIAESRSAAAEAQQQLDKLRESPAESVQSIKELTDSTTGSRKRLVARAVELEAELEQVRAVIRAHDTELESLAARHKAAEEHQASINAAKEIIAKFEQLQGPGEAAITAARAARDAASEAVDRGVLIRQAKRDQLQAKSHRESAAKAREKAMKCKDAGKITDEILANAINCPLLRVESDGKSAILATETHRGKNTPYYDLSDGQRGKIAIQIAAPRVGENGVLVLDQETWEGIDSFNRVEIHQAAVDAKLYILAMEATRRPEIEIDIARQELTTSE